ncbi:MAG: hydrogenase maturation protease [Candidatus Njordarchaeales archaeon]
MKTIVIGLGNDLLGDDSVGLIIAEELEKRLRCGDVVVKKMIGNAFSVLEECLGYDKAVIIDSIRLENLAEGEVIRFRINEVTTTPSTFSPHNVDLITAYNLLRNALPDQVPKDVIVYAVNISRNTFFGEKISEPIKKVVKKVVSLIINNDLRGC